MTRILLVAIALIAAPLGVCAQAKDGPTRLASLAIEIWPEYDRPAALVILRGVLAEGVALPAPVTLRLPAAAGAPAAVAYATSADGNLLNLQHEHAKSGDYVTVRFQAPERFFHVEFYEPIATGEPSRTYRYAWPGDFAVARATVVVQEPASARDIVTEPDLKERSPGAGGLDYRAGDLGALAAGKAVPITVKYTKADARPSVDIKGMRAAQAPLPSGHPAIAAPVSTESAGALPHWFFPMAALALLGILGSALVALLRRRQASTSAAAYCTKCGAPLRRDDVYCGKCGTRIKAAAA